MSYRRSHTVCRFYLLGTCRFGDFCRFSHDVTPNTSSFGSESPQRSEISDDIAEAKAEEKEEQVVASTSSYSRQKIWANAPVFVPRCKSIPAEMQSTGDLQDICPYGGTCIWGKKCSYPLHMEICKMCDLYCLHPRDLNQRREHNRECLEQHEQAMELSFAIARSKDKTCGICFDTIVEKKGRERRFGILSKCKHTFCLKCIRTWRQAEQFESTVTRGCPECRVCSDFVCPSAYWVDTKEEKDKLLNEYRTAMGAKDCKYFKMGLGKCPFGNKCFYRHSRRCGINQTKSKAIVSD
ncbi:E3 ubiquitin-protein ligase makorin-1-like [Drosophila teissieri]|uniref:E3 ubiquitin-protein ligase makorin-1-like n=1 Tax=Drosophila teissieri TaxID=7243 RepID=UPI001CB9DC72|nr:E3 ubiquitin-protein ligase makorin-1-like [Drosophila teissieri]